METTVLTLASGVRTRAFLMRFSGRSNIALAYLLGEDRCQDEGSRAMKKLFAVSAAAVLMVFGALGLVVASTGSSAVAQETETTEPDAPRFTTLEDVLHGLVERDVIDEEQADAVADALRDAFWHRGPWMGEKPEDFDPDRRPDRFRPHRFRGFGFFGGAESLTDLLGMTPDELRAALADGQTLSEIIDDPDSVVEAIVQQAAVRLTLAVEAGRLTQEKADELLDQVRNRAEAFLNGELDGFGRFRGPRGIGQFGPRGEDVDA